MTEIFQKYFETKLTYQHPRTHTYLHTYKYAYVYPWSFKTVSQLSATYPVTGHTEIWEHVFNFYEMELIIYLFI